MSNLFSDGISVKCEGGKVYLPFNAYEQMLLEFKDRMKTKKTFDNAYIRTTINKYFGHNAAKKIFGSNEIGIGQLNQFIDQCCDIFDTKILKLDKILEELKYVR